MSHHESAPAPSQGSSENLYLPASIILSALLLSMAMGLSAWEVSDKLTLVSTSLKSLQVGVAAPSAGAGDAGGRGDAGNDTPDQPQQPIKIDMKKLSEGFPTKGNADAPITIVEFSDLQCPFCGSWFKNAYKQINENYIKTGKVKLVYRHFPLSSHPEAAPAANATECANEQGKFWEMHDKIFLNQAQLSAANYKAWAKDLGLDTAKFDSCYDSKKYDSKVTADFSEGASVGVSGTPTFFVNGQMIVGAQPYETFKQVIDAELAG